MSRNSLKAAVNPRDVYVVQRNEQAPYILIPMKSLNPLHIALIYLLIINVITFFLFGIDKLKAKRSRWRISEALLLGMAAIGGSIGAWLGMMVWHHKTQHKKFRYGIPLILLVQIGLLVFSVISCH